MTEDEAKTKWCPQARFKFSTASESPSSNREGGPSAGQNHWLISGTRCLASECAAWRWGRRDWVRVEFTDGTVRDGERPENLPPEGPWPAPVRNVTPLSDEGYCGLAGVAQ